MTVDVERHAKAATVLPEVRLLAGDVWSTRGRGSLRHVNPATTEVQAEVPLASAAEVDEVVVAAEAAAPAWRDTTPLRRRELLSALADRIRQSHDEFATMLTLETGLPVGLTRVFGERGTDFLDYYAGLAQAIEGEYIPANPVNTLNYVVPEPYGVVALIMTWNGGLAALGRKAGAAIAAGNTVVIKPSELAPFTTVRFAEFALEVGFPPGVVNVLHGDGVAGDHLVRSKPVRKVSFTGGIGAARKIQAAAAAAPKPVALELGGKSANIVFPDADLERAALSAATGALYMSGQGCALPTRLLIHSSVYDRVLDLVLESASRMAAGDPLEPSTMIGPIVSESHRDRILGMIQRAVDSKAGELRVGGGRAEELAPGFFLQPTVFSDVDPSSEIAQEEVFGPVLTVFRFEDDDEAVAIANSTEYGLNAFLHTSSLDRAHTMARRLEAGSVAVNGFQGAGNRGAVATPFGGVKGSGFGREGGKAGLEEFLTLKNVSVGLAG
jgi:acyl-CoA reductase-like NAD-dependent aldehyde dehydrogenase